MIAFTASPSFLHQPRRSLQPRRCNSRTLKMTDSRVFVGDVGKKAAAHVSLVAPAGSSVAVSGGSLPKILAKGLEESGASDLPSKWAQVFLADERCVPLDHADSNYRSAKEQLKCQPIPIDPSLPASACAADYAAKLTEKLGKEPVLDCVLLGLGPDGHTCSLFPGHALVRYFFARSFA